MGFVQSAKNAITTSVGVALGTAQGIVNAVTGKSNTPTTNNTSNSGLSAGASAGQATVGAVTGTSNSSGTGYGGSTGGGTSTPSSEVPYIAPGTSTVAPTPQKVDTSYKSPTQKDLAIVSNQWLSTMGGQNNATAQAILNTKTGYYFDDPRFEKGFVTEDGKFYPSTNKDYVPTGYTYKEPTEKIIYNDSGEVSGVESSAFQQSMSLDAYNKKIEEYNKSIPVESYEGKSFGGGSKFTAPAKDDVLANMQYNAETVQRQDTTLTAKDKQRMYNTQEWFTNPKEGSFFGYLSGVKKDLITPDNKMFKPGASTKVVSATPDLIILDKKIGGTGNTWEYKPGYIQYATSGLIPGTPEQATILGLTSLAGYGAMKVAKTVTSAGFTYYGAKSVPNYFNAQTPEEKAGAAAGTLGIIAAPGIVSGGRGAIADILAFAQKKKPVVQDTIFMEPTRGKVQGQIITNIQTPKDMKAIDVFKLKNTPSQRIGSEILNIQGKRIPVAHITAGDLFQRSIFKPFTSKVRIENMPGSPVQRPFESGLYTSIPEPNIKILYDPKALSTATETGIIRPLSPSIPKTDILGQSVIKIAQQQGDIVGGSFAQKTAFSEARQFGDYDVISYNPVKSAKLVVQEASKLGETYTIKADNNPIYGKNPKQMVFDKAGNKVAEFERTVNGIDLTKRQILTTQGLKTVSPKELFADKTAMVKMAGENIKAATKAAGDIEFLSGVSKNKILTPTETPGAAQGFSYYAKGGEGTFSDLLSGKATPTLGGRPKAYIGEVDVQSYPKDLLIDKITPEQLSSTEVILKQIESGKIKDLGFRADVTKEEGARFASEIIKRAGGTIEGVARERILGEYASKTPGFRPGTGAILGFKPESELVGGAGTIIGKNPVTFRGKVGKILGGFGDFPVKSDGQKIEFTFIKELTPKTKVNPIKELTIEEQSAFFKSRIQEIASGTSSSGKRLYYDISKPLVGIGSISGASALYPSVNKVNSVSLISRTPSTNLKISNVSSYKPVSVSSSSKPFSVSSSYKPISGRSSYSPISSPSSYKLVSGPSSYKPVSSRSSYSPISSRSNVSGPSSYKPLSNRNPFIPPSNYNKKAFDFNSIKRKQLRGKAFDVQVKEKGVWTSQNVALTEKQAGLFAQERLRKTLAASARLVPTTKALQQAKVRYAPKQGEFRQFTIKKGQKIYNPRLFIQSTGSKSQGFSRLGTRAEKIEIQSYKKSKKKRRGFF